MAVGTGSAPWVPVPFVDTRATEEPFRHKVVSLPRDEELLSDARTELLMSRTRDSPFRVWRRAEDPEGIEPLARYLLRTQSALSVATSHARPLSSPRISVAGRRTTTS